MPDFKFPPGDGRTRIRGVPRPCGSDVTKLGKTEGRSEAEIYTPNSNAISRTSLGTLAMPDTWSAT